METKNVTNPKRSAVNADGGKSTNKTSNQSTQAGTVNSTTSTRDTLYRGVNPSEPLPIPYKFNENADSAIVTWLSKYDPTSLPALLSDAFRLGPVQSSLGITKPIVWLANLSCDFKRAYATIDDPHNIFGPTLGGRRRIENGKRTYPREFSKSEQDRFDKLQDMYHNQRWHNLLALGYDPATAATMVGAVRENGLNFFSPPPLFALSPRMIVTEDVKRLNMAKILNDYLNEKAEMAEKELLAELEREENEKVKKSNKKKKSKNKKNKRQPRNAGKDFVGDHFADYHVNGNNLVENRQCPTSITQSSLPRDQPIENEMLDEKTNPIEYSPEEPLRNQTQKPSVRRKCPDNNAISLTEPTKVQNTRVFNEEDKLIIEHARMKKLADIAAASSTSSSIETTTLTFSTSQLDLEKTLDAKDGSSSSDETNSIETKTTERGPPPPLVPTEEEDTPQPGYAWCCDYCKKAPFPTFAEAALHEFNCKIRMETGELDGGKSEENIRPGGIIEYNDSPTNEENITNRNDTSELQNKNEIIFRSERTEDGNSVVEEVEKCQPAGDAISSFDFDDAAEDGLQTQQLQQNDCLQSPNRTKENKETRKKHVPNMSPKEKESSSHGETSTYLTGNGEEKGSIIPVNERNAISTSTSSKTSESTVEKSKSIVDGNRKQCVTNGKEIHSGVCNSMSSNDLAESHQDIKKTCSSLASPEDLVTQSMKQITINSSDATADSMITLIGSTGHSVAVSNSSQLHHALDNASPADQLTAQIASLKSENERLKNSHAIERQRATEAVQRVQLKAFIAETARDAAEERSARFETLLVDAITDMVSKEVVQREMKELIAIASTSVDASLPLSRQIPTQFDIQQKIPSATFDHDFRGPLETTNFVQNTHAHFNKNHDPIQQYTASHYTPNPIDSWIVQEQLSVPWVRNQSPRREGVLSRLRRGAGADE